MSASVQSVHQNTINPEEDRPNPLSWMGPHSSGLSRPQEEEEVTLPHCVLEQP